MAGLGHFLLTSEYICFSSCIKHLSVYSFVLDEVSQSRLQCLWFLSTGRIRRSCDVGVGGFILVTLGCWFHCRYNYAKLRIQERLAREGIKNKILYESTHLDPARKQTNGGSSGNWAVLSIENPDTIHFIVNKAEMNYRERFMYHLRQLSIK